jgi:hypothetical protein
MLSSLAVCVLLLLLPLAGSAEAYAQIRTKPAKITRYVPPRPPFAGLHVAMSEDSAVQIMHAIAKRMNTMALDSETLVESDSVELFGYGAYIQLQIVKHHVRTIVINFHPMGGGEYLRLRDQLDEYMEHYLGRGVALTNESITYHRWETEDGTSEVSHSDKYMRIFVRLGKPRI